MQPTSPIGPVRRALIDAGREMIRFALSEYTRADPVRFNPTNGQPYPIETPPDPRISYQPIRGCPWCQINLRLAGVDYVLGRAIAFPPGFQAYLAMARNELIGVRAMITGNGGEVTALENPLGQLQLRLIAQDPDVADLQREVRHLMDICTRAAETPSAPMPTVPVVPQAIPVPTGERIYGSSQQPASPPNGGSAITVEPARTIRVDDRVRDAGAHPKGR